MQVPVTLRFPLGVGGHASPSLALDGCSSHMEYIAETHLGKAQHILLRGAGLAALACASHSSPRGQRQ